jgi:DNA replication protein DnaC
MIAAAQARQSLEQLGLVEAAAVLDGRLEAAAQKQLPYADFLADLLSTETGTRRERHLRTQTRLAHLPFHRTLEQFDFRVQPSALGWSTGSPRDLDARRAPGSLPRPLLSMVAGAGFEPATFGL